MSHAMRPIRQTISLDEARALIEGAIKRVDRREQVPLVHANGRVLATDAIADRDVPPFARAAMDGYAVVAEDTVGASRQNPKVLRVVDKIYTGEVPGRHVGAGEAIEIATGAPMPAGADAVVMVEETDRTSDADVCIFTAVHQSQYVGRQGADIARGQTVLRAGDVLNPSRIGALAALGSIEIEAFAKPSVAILSTGNEIVEPGMPLAPGQIYDINRYTLTTIVAEHGGIPVPHQTAEDTIDDLDRAIDRCLDEDLLVFSGGSSVGERDLILDIIARRGEMLFHGLAVKPGKPTAFGLVSGKPVFGLPGYPTSCLLNAYILVVPALRQMAHLPPHQIRTLRAPLSQRVVSAPGRHQFYTVRLLNGEAHPAFKASGDITSMSQADGYIEIPAKTDIVEKGQVVQVKLF